MFTEALFDELQKLAVRIVYTKPQTNVLNPIEHGGSLLRANKNGLYHPKSNPKGEPGVSAGALKNYKDARAANNPRMEGEIARMRYGIKL
jgi:hypothetical protein